MGDGDELRVDRLFFFFIRLVHLEKCGSRELCGCCLKEYGNLKSGKEIKTAALDTDTLSIKEFNI